MKFRCAVCDKMKNTELGIFTRYSYYNKNKIMVCKLCLKDFKKKERFLDYLIRKKLINECDI